MKLFECQNCGQPLYFENTSCESCGLALGYLPHRQTVTALEAGELWRALADPQPLVRFCANARHDACNWLLPNDHPEVFCAACRHNRTIPDLTVPENLLHWRKIELAKHRLFYTLLKLGLPLTTRAEDANGLAFDFLSPAPQGSTESAPVVTGHAGGLITLNVAEADDPERERQRKSMGEPYRTLLGHFRHEIAHYYWDHLVADTPALGEFRQLFGDEREDYQAALRATTRRGRLATGPIILSQLMPARIPGRILPKPGRTTFTWSIRWRPQLPSDCGCGRRSPRAPVSTPSSTSTRTWPRWIASSDTWLPLTFAVNSINRSMGQPDLYPFVLPPPVIWKLAFVHERIHAAHVASDAQSADAGKNALRAIIASLKRPVSSPGVANPTNQQPSRSA